MVELTDKDMKWLREADKLFKRMPKGFMLYTCDGTIVVCKKGVNCRDVAWEIENSSINACCVIRDVHDDMGNGA